MNAESTPLIFQTAALSHQGCVRSHNEDNFITLPELGLWVVAVTLLLHTTHRRGRISDGDVPDGWGHPPAPRRRAR